MNVVERAQLITCCVSLLSWTLYRISIDHVSSILKFSVDKFHVSANGSVNISFLQNKQMVMCQVVVFLF